MLNFKPFLEGNWKCVHPQDHPWNQSQCPCTFQIYWNYHFCLCAHCQNSPKLHWTSEEHLWPCKYWNYANHFSFKFGILVPYFWSWVTRKFMYLPTFSESNVWDFRLVVTQRFLKTSHNFLKTSECCWKCPKMFWRPQAPPKLSKGTILGCFETVMTQSQH